jgi:hypothetical protein
MKRCTMTRMDEMERKHRAWFSPKYCVICGTPRTCIARAGFSSCEEHKMLDKPDHPLFDRATGEPLSQEAIPASTLPPTTEA